MYYFFIVKKIFFLFLILAVVHYGCNEDKNDYLIETKKFKNILIDMHLADGILQAENLQSKFNRKRDTITPYNFVLKKHNVSRGHFEKTVNYYTLHSEDYKIIYKSVIDSISKMEDEIKKINKKYVNEEKLKTGNLWRKKTEWNLPEDGKTKAISFKIKLTKHGTYTLSADIKMFSDDKSVGQRMTIIANYKDGTKEINTNGTIVKDNKYNNYKVSITSLPEKKLQSISGWVLDHSKGTQEKHAKVKNIMLKYQKK